MPRPSSGPVGTDVSLSEIGLQIVSAQMTAQLIETILSTAFFGECITELRYKKYSESESVLLP